MALRIVKAPICEWVDSSGNQHTAQLGQIIEASAASEGRLEALGVLAPVGHTVSQAEEEVTKRSSEYEAWVNGVGSRPVWLPEVVAAAGA